MGAIRKEVSNLIGKKENGVFLEAGALDGQYLSNTLWLEQDLNWTGILIEPDPTNFKDLSAKNRQAWTSNTCVSTTSYPKKIAMKSLKKLIVSEEFTWTMKGNTHDVEYPPNNNFENYADVEYHSVQCYPLYTYFLALNITEVDLIVLDTQGGEDDVLRNFPWDMINANIVVFEHFLNNTRNVDVEIIKFMNSHNYDLVSLTGEPDYIFVKRNHQFVQNYLKHNHSLMQHMFNKYNILQHDKIYTAFEIVIKHKTYNFYNMK